MLKIVSAILLWLFGSPLNQTPYRIAVIDNSSNPVVVSYYPDTGRVLVLVIPKNLTVEAAGGYGKYKLESLTNLAKQEQKGLELSRQTLTKSLGLFIRRVLMIDSIPKSGKGVDESKLLQQIGFNSNLQLWWKFRNVPKSKIQIVEFEARDLGDEGLDVDGSPVFFLNELKTDNKIDRLQQEYLSFNNALSVTIENSTRISGLAQETRRIMESEGWDVIRLSDGIEELPYSIIILGKENLRNHPLIHDLTLIFPGAEFRVEDTENYRSDVVIRLGYRGKGFWD